MLVGVLLLQCAILVAILSARQHGDGPQTANGSVAPVDPAGQVGQTQTGQVSEPDLVTMDDVLGQLMQSLFTDVKPVTTPFSSADMHSRMDRLMQHTMRDIARFERLIDVDDRWESLAFSPALDMREQDDAYIVVCTLPGASRSDIVVLLEGRLLTLHAPVHAPDRSGTVLGRFEQRVQIPGPVAAAEDVIAYMTNGILRVIVPKGHATETTPVRRRLL